MTQPSREQYLESKVLTASQPQLHMMLLDGAIQFGRKAAGMWAEGTEFPQVEPLLDRMLNIMDELAHGTATGQGEIAQQMEEQYAFIYRELAVSRVNQDLPRLQSCLRLLEFQRETWKLASEKLENKQANPGTAAQLPTPHINLGSTQVATGLSLEA